MWIKETWQNISETLDRGGFPAWIAASVLGFMVFWPLGLFFTINMFMRKGNRKMCNRRSNRVRSTGNTAFDRYREETLQRLEDEREAFSEYLQRLREARDQKEFDGWMKEMKTVSKA